MQKLGYFGAFGYTRNPYFVILGALLLFKNDHFDASLASGISYVRICTQYHPFSLFFTHFFLLISTTSTPF